MNTSGGDSRKNRVRNPVISKDTAREPDATLQPDSGFPLDASRVAVAGGSYGGHMTLAVSTFYSDRIRCSVDIVDPSNLVTFLEHTEPYRRDLRE
jgi:cephalosporin-C deacetylase-like acetyl esterase